MKDSRCVSASTRTWRRPPGATTAAAVVAEIKRLGLGTPDSLLFGRPAKPQMPLVFEPAWRRLLTEARITNFRFHDLRHSCASCGVAALGDQLVTSLDADIVGNALDRFAATPVQHYAGKKDGKPVLRAFGPRRPATINRSKSMLSAVLTWAQRRRMTPRGWRNPCREIPGLRENNARVRFLSNDERKRLLSLARVSQSRKLPVLMALVLL